MKNINRIILGFSALTIVALAPTGFASAQDKSDGLAKAVAEKQFVFHAQTALPMTGSSRQLTPEYDLKVSGGAIESALPFFGRAYSLPYNSTNGGFNFISKKFDYSATEKRKGGWEISIKPKDVQDFREFSLSISKDGYGTLQALSNNRQPMSFTGYITAAK